MKIKPFIFFISMAMIGCFIMTGCSEAQSLQDRYRFFFGSANSSSPSPTPTKEPQAIPKPSPGSASSMRQDGSRDAMRDLLGLGEDKAKKSETIQRSKQLSLKELEKYNGKNGYQALIAVDGKIYDVTDKKDWKSGRYKYGTLKAGNDLTKQLTDQKQKEDILKDLPVIGSLVKDSAR